jgi:hypothetical protein
MVAESPKHVISNYCILYIYRSCVDANGYSQKCEGNKKLLKIDPIVEYMNSKFSILCRLKENMSFDESLTLEGQIGIQAVHSLEGY